MINKLGNYENDRAKPEQQKWKNDIDAHIGTRRNNSTRKIVNSCNMMLTQYISLYQHLIAPEKDCGIPLDTTIIGNFHLAVDEKILLATSSMTSFLNMIDNAQDWATEDYFCQLQEKNNQIMKKENNAFLRKIRQYLNHYGLIPWEIIGGNTGNTFIFTIDSETMLNFDGWNRSDKKIIGRLGLRELSLASVIYDYVNEVVALWKPAIETLSNMNDKDLKESNALKRRAFLSLTDGKFASPTELYKKIESDLSNETLHKKVSMLNINLKELL